MTGRIILVGLNHKTAPVPIRERVAFSPGCLGESLQALTNHLPQGVILSTCNRTEVYTTSNGQSASDKLYDYFSTHSTLPIRELLPYLYTLEEEDVVRHLFRITAGLESMIIGEYEVLGQVRQAMEEAEASGLGTYPLSQLFRQAVRAGRRVREETDISKNAASVSSAAVGLAKQMFNDLERCHVLVVGAGEAGALVAKTLVKVGACQVTVTNRSYSKAEGLASEIGGTAIPFHKFGEALSSTDILISCSGAPHYIIEPSAIGKAATARPSQPILLIDIAVPRDVDPAVRGMDGVILYDIDDLSLVVQENRDLREREVDKATAIVEAEVRGFMDWHDSQDKAPIIKALVGKAEEIRSAQLAKTLKEIPTLTVEERERLEAMTKAIVKKILHSPISCLKNQNGNHVEAIQELFDLEIQGPPDSLL